MLMFYAASAQLTIDVDSSPTSVPNLLELLDSYSENENVLRSPNFKAGDLAKPIFQWVGGKREMLAQYAPYIPKSFNTYWEPFAGGAALFFSLRPENARLNDSNPELIRSYEAIRDNVDMVIRALAELRKKHSLDLYMDVRSLDRRLSVLRDIPAYETAVRMIYLNQTCFNGLYRVNKLGQFNVPIGSSLNRVICDPMALIAAQETLEHTKLTNLDFERHLDEARAGDFIYLDPPYHPVSEYSDFTRYTKERFYKFDQIRLRNVFQKLANRGCKVMLSNSDTAFIRDIYQDFPIHQVFSARNLNSRAEKRGKISELLITSY